MRPIVRSPKWVLFSSTSKAVDTISTAFATINVERASIEPRQTNKGP
jgi:hypothetical protein